MALPTYYDTGTVSIAAGGTVVTGVGTTWGSDVILPGDMFMVPGQAAIPPQRIASVASNTSLTLAHPWPGTTVTAGGYEVRYVGQIERSTAQTRRVLELLGQAALPQGGTAGQVLAKATGTDYDADWVDPVAEAVNVAVSAIAGLTATDAQAALAEIITILGSKQPLDDDLTTLAGAFATAASGTAAGLALAEATANGTSKITIAAPAALGADRTATFPDASGTIILGSTGGTDNRLLRADGAGGGSLQSSDATLDDNGGMTLLRLALGGAAIDTTRLVNAQVSGTDVWGVVAAITDTNTNAQMTHRRSRAAGADVASGDVVGATAYQVTHTATAPIIALFRAVVDGTPGANDGPGRFEWHTTPDGSSAPTESMRLGQDKRLTVHGAVLADANGGIGYAAGAGGAVTQATSKSTGVTLNKPSGAITMNGASLANSTTVTFTLTNSEIGANDTLSINHRSGGTAGAYVINAQCAAGSANINVRNISGGSLSEAIVLGFNLIKGAVA